MCGGEDVATMLELVEYGNMRFGMGEGGRGRMAVGSWL